MTEHTRDIVFGVRVTEQERQAIRQLAKRLRRSDSDVVRIAILMLAEQLATGKQTELDRGVPDFLRAIWEVTP